MSLVLKKKKMDERGLCDFNGVMIIPIPKREPVLILKDFARQFHYEDYLEVEKKMEFSVIFDYRVYWKGKNWKHQLPPEVGKEYGSFFHDFINMDGEYFYTVDSLPQCVIELPIRYILGYQEVKITDPDKILKTNRGYLLDYQRALTSRRGIKGISQAKEILRQIKVIGQTRGSQEQKWESNELVIATYEKLGSPKRIPIGKIRDVLEKQKFPSFSRIKIWRIIKKKKALILS